jgi:hypothetical protein
MLGGTEGRHRPAAVLEFYTATLSQLPVNFISTLDSNISCSLRILPLSRTPGNMDWADDNAICCQNEASKVFRYQERPTSVIRVVPGLAVCTPLSSLRKILTARLEASGVDNE